MAIGKNIYNSGNKKFLKLKLKGGARFAIIEQTSNGYEEIAKTKIVNGALKSISHKKFEYEGNDINTITLELVDNHSNETYLVDFNNESSLGRSIISSLLSLKELGHILQLSLYTKKYKDQVGETKTTDSIGVSYNGELLKWHYNIADKSDKNGLPAVEEKTVKGKKTLDSFNRDLFLLDELIKKIDSLPEPTTLASMPNTDNVKAVIEDTDTIESVFNDSEDISDTPF